MLASTFYSHAVCYVLLQPRKCILAVVISVQLYLTLKTQLPQHFKLGCVWKAVIYSHNNDLFIHIIMMPMHPDLLEQVGHTFPQKANAEIHRAACSVQSFTKLDIIRTSVKAFSVLQLTGSGCFFTFGADSDFTAMSGTCTLAR